MPADAKLPDSGQAVPPNAVYNYWKEFDLETLRGTLDEKGLAIAETQEASVKSRKQLAEKTKEFRRSVPPETFKQLAPLLKLYQEEVDALTARAKLGEGSFLEVFKLVYEAPDPAPAIALGLELASKATELETQVAKTAAELSEYKAESKNIRNQDVTIRRLEERVRLLEAELEEKDEEVAAAREEAAAELEARSADDARQREERLEAELSRAEAALEAMRRMHQSTQAQLFSVQERGEEAAAAARAEAALTAAEIERAEERLLQLAKERDALLDKVHGEGGDASKPAAADVSSAQVTALREEIKTQRDLISRLQAELAGASKKAAAEAAAAAAKVASLEVTLSATEAHATALEGELAGRPTQKELEEARQQVRVLNAVLHNTVGEEDDEAGTPGQGGTSAAAADGHVVGSLETALLAKNRHLEHKLTMAHLEAAEARTAAEAASASLAEAEAEVERQKALITRLEEDLIAAEDAGGLAGSEGGTGGDGGDASNAMLARTPSSGGDQTLLSVLSAQRDRLRGRVQELEAQSAAAQHAVVKAKQDLEAARADNVALVERLRYVQGYAKGGGDLEAGSAAVNRYMRDYEEKVNPFTDFKERERAARRKQMPIQDRAAYAVGSALVSSNKVARSAIVIYALALHLIAFLVLAGFSSRHVDKMEELEEMCSQLSLVGSNSVAVNSSVAGVDPVVGGGMAAVVQEAVGALRRRLMA